MKNKILVTGACGFIGSHLTELLVNEGYNVKAFVQYNSFNSWGWLDHIDPAIQKEIEIFSGDIRDPFGVHKAMRGCTHVIHLAALIGIPYSYYSPENYLETNIKGTLNVVEAAKELGVEKILHTSTSEVYGTAQYVPIDEAHPLQPQSPYSATKIAADQIALSYYNAFNLPLTIIRPFNTYGPRQSLRAVIPTIITQLLNNAEEIQLGDLTPTRDFTYVTDTAKAFICALNAKNIEGEIINLGVNYDISIGYLCDLICQLMNKKIKILLDTQRVRPEKSEVMRLCSDNTKAKKLLNWQPTFPANIEGLRIGLEKTIEWFSNRDNNKDLKSGIYNV